MDHLPQTMTYFACCGNQLTSLNHLPSTLDVLFCVNNQLTSIKNIPPILKWFVCADNQLTSLDKLPPTISWLNCSDNLLNSIYFTDDPICLLEKPLFFKCENNNFLYEPTIEDITKESFKLYYRKVHPPMYKEELMQKVFHPTRVWNYLDQFNYNILTEEVF
jgi:hypothetical protein